MKSSISPAKNTTSPDNNKHGGTKVGLLLSVFALVLVGIASLLIRPPVIKSGTPGAAVVTTKAVATATTSILAMPLAVGAFALGGIAIILAVVRMARVKTTGAVLNIVVIALSLWAFSAAVHVFKHIAAKH